MRAVRFNSQKDDQTFIAWDIGEGDWKTISFTKKKVLSTRSKSPTNSATTDINAKIFDADTCKYLNTQKLRYIEKEPGNISDSDKNIKYAQSKYVNSSKQTLDTSNKFAHLMNLPTVCNETIIPITDGLEDNQCMQMVMNIPKDMSLHMEPTREALEIGTQSLEHKLLKQNIIPNSSNIKKLIQPTKLSNTLLNNTSNNPNHNESKKYLALHA